MNGDITIYTANGIKDTKRTVNRGHMQFVFILRSFYHPAICKNDLDIFATSLKYVYRSGTFAQFRPTLRDLQKFIVATLITEPSWKFRLAATSHNEFLCNILSRKRKRSAELATTGEAAQAATRATLAFSRKKCLRV